MITKLTLRNFKNVGEQSYDFTQFDLLVGRNNSGKSTILQALAIWQFCVDEFQRSSRSGAKGIQVVLPNFTALPVPEFILLWKDRTERRNNPHPDGSKKQEYILIEIILDWKIPNRKEESFGVQLRYQSPQTIYAIPKDGWAKFREYHSEGSLPKIAYVPPFSGLEPSEKWLDRSPIRQQVGKGQPGSVLRNLLLTVCPSPRVGDDGRNSKDSAEWKELAEVVKRWFSVQISPPKYDSTKDVYISVVYSQNGKEYDIIAGGSGFHQTLTLLAFLYGYRPTTILLDEPDAHLHVNLQREILEFFKRKSYEMNVQFLIATHAEEFVKGVDAKNIVSLLNVEPKRIESTPEVLKAMAEVSNEEIARLMASPYILYVEGESDERILRAWSSKSIAKQYMDKVFFKAMSGGDKKAMKQAADEHFKALRLIIPNVSRLMVFDYDDEQSSLKINATNPAMVEWGRKNIENYLLVPEAWKRAVQLKLGYKENDNDLFLQPFLQIIDDFFISENLTLPPGKTWQNVSANVFKAVNGKRLLFESDNALFRQLREKNISLSMNREDIALEMTSDEMHEDVNQYFSKLDALFSHKLKIN